MCGNGDGVLKSSYFGIPSMSLVNNDLQNTVDNDTSSTFQFLLHN